MPGLASETFSYSTDFHNSFESHPSRKSFPCSNLNPTVSTLVGRTRQIIAQNRLDKCYVTGYTQRTRNFAHKGLRTLYSDNSAKGVPPDSADKLRKMLAFLDAMQDPEELRAVPSWKPHTLTGNRKGTWSLTVTRNRRLTFRIHAADSEICDLDLEDYH